MKLSHVELIWYLVHTYCEIIY